MVHELVESENQPTMKNGCPSFDYSLGLEFSFVDQEDNNTDNVEHEQINSPAEGLQTERYQQCSTH